MLRLRTSSRARSSRIWGSRPYIGHTFNDPPELVLPECSGAATCEGPVIAFDSKSDRISGSSTCHLPARLGGMFRRESGHSVLAPKELSAMSTSSTFATSSPAVKVGATWCGLARSHGMRSAPQAPLQSPCIEEAEGVDVPVASIRSLGKSILDQYPLQAGASRGTTPPTRPTTTVLFRPVNVAAFRRMSQGGHLGEKRALQDGSLSAADDIAGDFSTPCQGISSAKDRRARSSVLPKHRIG